MKLRLDFVTNSSSSSYIIATKNNDKELMKKMDDVLLKWVKKMIFGQKSINTIEELNHFVEEVGWEKDSEYYLGSKKCLEKGYTVFYGEIYSEGSYDHTDLYEDLFSNILSEDVGFKAIDVELGY